MKNLNSINLTLQRHAQQPLFVQLCEQIRQRIISGQFDSEFRYAGRPIPALASLDDSDRIIYVGTFSKVFSVSLRLAYLTRISHQDDGPSLVL